MKSVAIEEAEKILEGCGECEVSIDESGKRPSVLIKARVDAARLAELDGRLRERFRDFEFLTVIELSAST